MSHTSRFTEHFDLNVDQLVHPTTLPSPSKSSFTLHSPSGSNSQLSVDSILLSRYDSYEKTSVMSFSESHVHSEKRLSGKLKRLLSTMSKKKSRSGSTSS